VRTALQDAASVACAIITTEAAIVEDDTATLPKVPDDLGAL
jgi:chaperonin GroEL (HSP60 family)